VQEGTVCPHTGEFFLGGLDKNVAHWNWQGNAKLALAMLARCRPTAFLHFLEGLTVARFGFIDRMNLIADFASATSARSGRRFPRAFRTNFHLQERTIAANATVEAVTMRVLALREGPTRACENHRRSSKRSASFCDRCGNLRGVLPIVVECVCRRNAVLWKLDRERFAGLRVRFI
jgi:hypothetical protein